MKTLQEITLLVKPYRIRLENGKTVNFHKLYAAAERLKVLRKEGRKVNLYLHYVKGEPVILA